MKIAIKGHKSRGKEIIQIFKDLGTEGLMDHTGSHIDWVYLRDDSLRPNQLIIGTDVTFLKGYNYKVYTLEEFEEKFPFKLGDKVLWPVKTGWWSGIIVDLNQNYYKIKDDKGDYYFVESSKLSLYPMQKERNITLTLEKAQEWYKKGGELKEIALQAFTEKELNPLPRSWEEFAANNARMGYYISTDGKPLMCASSGKLSSPHVCPSKKSAEAHLAMMQLEQLRDCWRNGWKPDWNNNQQAKYYICYYQGKFKISMLYETRRFLSFPTHEMAEEFLKCFGNLIEQAGDLI